MNFIDTDMDIDELFGDGAALNIPPEAFAEELHQRIDELRTGGCCQQIAWSKSGSIASVASDGYTLEIRHLRSHPEDGKWGLSRSNVSNFNSSQDGGPIRHLIWSPTGSELAVIDSVGRVTILAIFASLNKLNIVKSCHIDSVDDLQTVVGSYWLPLAAYPPGRPTFLNGPGVKEGSGYRYEASQAPVMGPCHPNHNKSAFTFVTTNGLLKLLWPQSNGKWGDVHTELESIVSSDDLITHAAICPDKSQSPHGILMIAFATASKQLRTARALIDWNIPKTEKVSASLITLNPTIRTRHLAVANWASKSPSNLSSSTDQDLPMTQLSHLEFLPPVSDSSAKLTSPIILTTRSYIPESDSHYNSEVHTVFDQWEVREKSQSLNPAFEQLGLQQSTAGTSSNTISVLEKIQSVLVDKIIISLEVINLGKIIFLAYSDGSVEYRERINFNETFNDNDINKVWHFAQIGYVYAEEEPCLQVALSPTTASLIYLNNHGKLKWNQLELNHTGVAENVERAIYAARIAALSLLCSTAVMRNSNYDDLLALAVRYLSPQLAYDWLIELARILKLQADYSDDSHHDLLVRNITIQLCLSIQSSLGFKGNFKPRDFGGRNAWLILQLRNIVVLTTMAANLVIPGSNPNEKITPLEDPEIITALTGSVRWVLDLLAWLIDSLLSLPRTITPSINLTEASKLSLSDLEAYLYSKNDNSLHLLLASTTRGFLTAICRRLQHLDYIAVKAIIVPAVSSGNHSPISEPLRAAYREIAALTSSAVVKLETILTLLHSVSSTIRNINANHLSPQGTPVSSEKVRNLHEIKLLFGGPFPEIFKAAIAELYMEDGLLETLREDIDEGQLFFSDFEILELDENEICINKKKQMDMTMDCFRKQWIQNPLEKFSENLGSIDGSVIDLDAESSWKRAAPRWRRCTRCTAVSEEISMQRQSLQWLVLQQRRCFCSGYWCILAPGETVA